MSFILSEEVRKGIDNGVYQGVCVGLVDLGTQDNTHFKKKERKWLLMWELPDVMIEFEKDGEKITAPKVISKQYTRSFAEKSNIRKDLQSWRGKPFTEEELKGFDLSKILGVNCMLQIINDVKGEKSYPKVTTILPLYRGIPEAKPHMDFLVYGIDDEIPDSMPGWIKSLILKSEEKLGAETGQTEPNYDDAPPLDDCPF